MDLKRADAMEIDEPESQDCSDSAQSLLSGATSSVEDLNRSIDRGDLADDLASLSVESNMHSQKAADATAGNSKFLTHQEEALKLIDELCNKHKLEFLKQEVEQLLLLMEKHPQRQAACAALVMKTFIHSVTDKTCDTLAIEQVVDHLFPAVSEEFIDGVQKLLKIIQDEKNDFLSEEEKKLFSETKVPLDRIRTPPVDLTEEQSEELKSNQVEDIGPNDPLARYLPGKNLLQAKMKN